MQKRPVLYGRLVLAGLFGLGILSLFAIFSSLSEHDSEASELPHVNELLRLAHVEVDTIKSGAFKDVGSPLRPMTAEERAYFQSFVSAIYEQFLDDVAQARKLDQSELRKIADGRVLTGAQAKEARLVDALGNLEDAVDDAARLAGQTGEPVPLFPHKPGHGLVGELLRGAGEELTPRGSIELRDPRF